MEVLVIARGLGFLVEHFYDIVVVGIVVLYFTKVR